MSAFLGMRGSGDWGQDVRPKNWREMILHEYPNGTAPLTALLAKIPSERVDDAEFNWWTKDLATQAGDIDGVYLNSALSNDYSTDAKENDVLYIKVEEDVADEFREGHQAILRDASDPDVDVNAKVVTVVKDGSTSYIACKLLEDDDNSTRGNLSDADRILVCGDINPEGGAIRDAVSYDPVKFTNKCQIIRTPLDITRTARRTRLRTGDAYKEMKREALEIHSIMMEKAFFWSVQSEKTGTNGKPERTMDGVISFIRKYVSSNVIHYNLDTSYSGKTWLQGGEEWMDESLELGFRFGSQEKIGYAGSGALLGIQRLAKAGANIQIKVREMAYGIKVVEWVTPFGTLFLKTHPLFSYEPSNRNMIVIVDPKNLRYKYVDDTFFKKDDSERKGGQIGVDGTKEEYLTECSLEMWHPHSFMYLTGLGLDNTV